MRTSGRWKTVVDVLGALVLLPLFALAASRLLRLEDRLGRVFALQTLTLFVYLPAYVIAGVACLARRRLLASLALGLVVAHVAWTLPDIGFGQSEPSTQPPTFSIVTANVAATNPRPSTAASTLLATGADVVIIVELTPKLQRELDGAGFVRRYPHRIEDPRDGFFGSGIYSTFPLERPEKIELAGLPTVRAKLVLGDERVDLVAVHTIQPLADLGTLRRQLQGLAQLAATTQGPLVLAGDFNATRQNRPFRQLLGTRMRDSHLDRRRGLARTWPTNLGAPPFVLIDHILVSEEIQVHYVAEFTIPGSDHRGVAADLRLP